MNKLFSLYSLTKRLYNISEVNIKLKVYPSIYNQYGNANEVIALCSSKDIILKPSEYYDFYLGQCFEIDTSTLLNETLIKDKSSNKVLFTYDVVSQSNLVIKNSKFIIENSTPMAMTIDTKTSSSSSDVITFFNIEPPSLYDNSTNYLAIIPIATYNGYENSNSFIGLIDLNNISSTMEFPEYNIIPGDIYEIKLFGPIKSNALNIVRHQTSEHITISGATILHTNDRGIIIKIENLTSIKVTLDNLPSSNAIGGASYSSLSSEDIIDLLTIHQNNWKSRLRYIRLNSTNGYYFNFQSYISNATSVSNGPTKSTTSKGLHYTMEQEDFNFPIFDGCGVEPITSNTGVIIPGGGGIL